MKSILPKLILFCLLLTACEPAEKISNASLTPNIIILFCDDMGYGDMGNTGHTTIRTPNLDRLAMDGMRFTNFYSGSPACTASRYALLTGRYPVRSGFSWVLYPKSERGIHPKEITIAEALKKKGYATAAYGKWHLGSTKPDYLPLQNGFDEYLGLPYSNDMIPPKWASIPLWSNNDTLELDPDQTQLTKLYTQKAIDFIDENQDQPFFIYLPYAMPHVPLFPGADFAGGSKRGPYGDVIEEIDWSVGAIREALEAQGLAENTLVFFTSDNGPWIIKDEKGGSSGLLRDGKGSTWEGGMHVPGIAYWKGKIQGGSVSLEVASTLDILPTVLDITQQEVAAGQVLDGESLVERFSGEEGKEHQPYFYYGQGNQLFAVRKGPWKLHIKTYSQTGETYFEKEMPLLFNLDIDPSEKYECSEKEPAVVEELLGLIAKHQEKITNNPGFYGQ